MLKLKAFIYRFSDIFGLHIYLAKKEEQEYISKQVYENDEDDIHRGCDIGLWQANHGFTTVWTWRQPWYKALWRKTKHAFDFRSWE